MARVSQYPGYAEETAGEHSAKGRVGPQAEPAKRPVHDHRQSAHGENLGGPPPKSRIVPDEGRESDSAEREAHQQAVNAVTDRQLHAPEVR